LNYKNNKGTFMIISPITAIEQGWVTHPNCTTVDDFKSRNFVSPNALDFTLDTVYTINSDNPFVISEKMKQMRGGLVLAAIPHEFAGMIAKPYWELEANTVYDGMSDFFVEVPEGVAALLIVRSTFNRNGLFITSGLYDQKFVGNIGFALHNRSGIAFIAPGTRIGQVIFVKSENSGIMYTGNYNTKEGQHWSEKETINIH
jgi:deoxycytidine triphosphate deaminase